MTEFIAREWYLIQRLMERTVPRPDGKGVDTLVSHDYMGSAEFEWGAIPSSWSKLRELAAAGKLVHYETPFHSIKNTPFYVIASIDDDRDIVFKGIAELGANGVHTKEPTYMDAWLKVLRVNDSTKYKREVSAWLRVSDNSRRHNPLLWCVDQKLATQLWMNLTEGKSVQAPPGVVTEPVKSIDPSELTMFDNITFEHHAKTWTGQIRGIYSDHVQVRRPDGGKQCVKYESIRSYSK